MVYVYAKKSELQEHISREVSLGDIRETLQDLGMDLKGESEESDPELKIEITAEKMDMVSSVGVARAIDYYRGYSKSLRTFNIGKGENRVIVKESVKEVRPKTVSAIVKDLPINEELLDTIIDLQEKLHASFGRGRKKAAIGIYPFDNIEFPVTYGAEKPEDIVFRPLESEADMNGKEIIDTHEIGQQYAHLLREEDKFPVFRDNRGYVLSMPPIINSHTTGRVTPQHKDLFIECSGFNEVYLDSILKVIVTTLLEFGGNAESLKVQYPDSHDYELSLDKREEQCSIKYLESLIGISFEETSLKELLNKVQLELIEQEGDTIKVGIPCYRQDIWNDCDIGDDLARAYGFNSIIPTTPNILSTGEQKDHSVVRNQVRDVMTNLGFVELYTYMLTSSKTQFDDMRREAKDHVSINDSAEEGINMTRTMILPENLESLRINRKHKYPQKVFETGFIIEEDESQETGAKDSLVLSATIADPKANLTQIKEIVDALSSLFSWDFEIRESSHPSFISGRCGAIYSGDKQIGVFGELNPQVLENFDLIVPMSSLEINLEKLFSQE